MDIYREMYADGENEIVNDALSLWFCFLWNLIELWNWQI